jgi:hypothetical protein
VTVLALVLAAEFAITSRGEAKTLNSNQGASAQSQSGQNEIRDLTIRLVGLNTRYQMGRAAERASVMEELGSVAAMRREMLAVLIESDPAEVLRVALPEGFGSNLPSKVRENLEQHVDLEGKLEVLYACGEAESHLSHFLNVAGKRLSLHFVGTMPGDLLTDSQVRVKGVKIGEAIALDSNTLSTSTTNTSYQVTTPVYPNTFGEQKVLVLLINFQDNPTQPWTIDQVRNTVFTSANNYYLEASYQQAWLTGDVYGWYTLPIASTCDTSMISTYAKQAATAAGINLSSYNRLVYAYPSVGCGWTGTSTLGGSPSQAWINGSMILRTVSHELGHGFGLYHSSASECGSQVVGTSCSSIEYGDVADIMGQPGVTGHFNSYQKERLGWLGYGISPATTIVQASGTYSIDPYESSGSNSKALKILKSTDPTTGKNTWYYLEFRRPVGFDSFISSNNNVMNGVMIHMGTDLAGYNYLLDLTPDTSSWSDAALDVGYTYNDPNINVTIAPTSVSNIGALVNITFGPQPCIRANPSMTVSPAATQWTSAGLTTTWTALITNNDSGGCTDSSFNLQANVPSGWVGAFANGMVSIAAGASSSTTLQVTSPAGTVDGFYNSMVTAGNASDATYSTSSSATCAIISSLGVSISSDQASYTRNQTATVTAFVTGGGSPLSGVSVVFAMKKANGVVVTGAGTTGANGLAVFKYRFNKQKDPTGTYQVSASASSNGMSGSGTAIFSVK